MDVGFTPVSDAPPPSTLKRPLENPTVTPAPTRAMSATAARGSTTARGPSVAGLCANATTPRGSASILDNTIIPRVQIRYLKGTSPVSLTVHPPYMC